MRTARDAVTFRTVDRDDEATSTQPDDLSREVYCILGMPIDAVDMDTALSRIEAAAGGTNPFLISTPNLNFLASSLSDPDFRESLLLSDLCTADGMPIVWIARLLGIPIKQRVAGSAMFDALASRSPTPEPLSVYLFGGPKGAADAAGNSLNERRVALQCVGTEYPGFGTLDDMSSDDVIGRINASKADFLVVALGAAKGQAWLRRNHDRIRTPIRAHLGAVVNFHAGTVKRSPQLFQKLGLEWLWRIKEEPRLAGRYWKDGKVLARLLFTRILPLVAQERWSRANTGDEPQSLGIRVSRDSRSAAVTLSGRAVADQIDTAIRLFRDALATGQDQLIVDISEVTAIDQRFLGLMLMIRKRTDRQGTALRIIGASPSIERAFRLNEVGYLLSGAGERRGESSDQRVPMADGIAAHRA